MLVSAVIQITSCGSSTGPFDLYYDSVTPANLLASNVSCTELVAGYTVNNLPNTAVNIILDGVGICTDIFTIPIVIPTPTPTPTPGLDCSFTFVIGSLITPTPTATVTRTAQAKA